MCVHGVNNNMHSDSDCNCQSLNYNRLYIHIEYESCDISKTILKSSKFGTSPVHLQISVLLSLYSVMDVQTYFAYVYYYVYYCCIVYLHQALSI